MLSGAPPLDVARPAAGQVASNLLPRDSAPMDRAQAAPRLAAHKASWSTGSARCKEPVATLSLQPSAKCRLVPRSSRP
jgi:hypothetical protein